MFTVLVSVQLYEFRFKVGGLASHVGLNITNPAGFPLSLVAFKWTLDRNERKWCPRCCLPKTLHCSAVPTVSRVIFSFISHNAKIITHRRTTVVLPNALLSPYFYRVFPKHPGVYGLWLLKVWRCWICADTPHFQPPFQSVHMPKPAVWITFHMEITMGLRSILSSR